MVHSRPNIFPNIFPTIFHRDLRQSCIAIGERCVLGIAGFTQSASIVALYHVVIMLSVQWCICVLEHGKNGIHICEKQQVSCLSPLHAFDV